MLIHAVWECDLNVAHSFTPVYASLPPAQVPSEWAAAYRALLEAEQSDGKAVKGHVYKSATRAHIQRVIAARQTLHALLAKQEGR